MSNDTSYIAKKNSFGNPHCESVKFYYIITTPVFFIVEYTHFDNMQRRDGVNNNGKLK